MTMRRRRLPLIIIAGPVVALCAALGACALPDEAPPPPASPPKTPAVSAPVERPPAPPVKPEKRMNQPAARQKAPTASPDELIGLDEAGVRKLLGPPAETKTDGAAKILAYRSVGCTLEVVFFLDLKAGDLRVLDYQWDGNKVQAAKGCYAELRVSQ